MQSSAEVGIWMFRSPSLDLIPDLIPETIADWLESPQDILGELVVDILEPINVIWVDYTATDEEDARQHVEDFLSDPDRIAELGQETVFFTEGDIGLPCLTEIPNRPACLAHTIGYWGWYDGEMVPQWPIGDAWVDKEYPTENNHGRAFAAVNVGTTEQPVFYTLGAFSRESSWEGLSGHDFVSFNRAQQAVLGAPCTSRPCWATPGDTLFGWIYERFDTDWGNRLDVQTTFDHAGVAVLVRPPLDLVGVYLGSGTATNTGCTDPDINTTFNNAFLRIEITEQIWNNFTGSFTFSLTVQGVPVVGRGDLNGTLAGTQVSGKFQASLDVAQANGTFTGSVTDASISLDFDGQTTVGETCTTRGQASGTKQ